MAHRRKNSHPLCKQKRISAVLDLLSAKTRQEDSKHDRDSVLVPDRTGSAPSSGDRTGNNKLDIPEDLLKDFLALRSATNLGTADLMRRLITDYSKSSTGDAKESTKSAPSDTETLSEYYQEDQDGYVITQNRRSPGEDEIPDKDVASPTVPLVEDDVHCSMTSPQLNDGYTYLYDTKSMEESAQSNIEEQTTNRTDDDVYSDDDNDKDGLQVKFQNGAVTIEGTKYNPKIHMDSPDAVNKGPPPPYPYMSMQGGVSGMVPVAPGAMGPGFPVLPEHVPPEVLAMMNSTQINPMISGGISECESLEGNIAGCMPTDGLQHEKPRNQQLDDGASLDTLSDTAQSRLWAPLPSKRPYVHSNKYAKKKKENGKMKLIAENTSNHGVYTSVLKLPWSKRTRTPKVDAGKHIQFTNYEPPKIESPQTCVTNASSKQYVQDSGGKKLRPNDQQPDIQPQELHQPTSQPSFVFLPVPTGNMPTSQGIFIPTPNLSGSIPGSLPGAVPMDPHVAAAQSMMMVYPNTNINSSGKTVRKRGRPPKIPAMAKVAPEEKQLKFDSSYPAFIPQPFPPAAIVLNVNNMLNTGNNVAASNTISNSFSQCEVSSSTTQDVQNIVTSQKQDLAKPPIALHPNVQVPGPSACFTNMDNNKTCPPLHHNPPILPKLEPKQIVPQTNVDSSVPKSSSPGEMKMVTTTAMANASTGALYQEMVLSSKSLVSVRPRRRQSTSEYLKAKSSDQNFICTSFRLRSLSSAKKDKKMSQYVSGMKRRGRPPKKRLENMFEGQMVEVNQNEMEDFNRQNLINLQRIREQREDYGFNGVDEKIDSVVDQFEVSGGLNQQPETLKDDTKVAEDGSDDMRSMSPAESPESSRCYDVECGEVEQNEPNEMFHQLFHCKVCNDIVPVEKKDEHYLKHSKGNNFCGTCGAAFQRVVCNDANGDTVELLKCENCEQASQNDNQGQAIFCPDCGESFSNPLTLKHHRQLEHPSPLKSHSDSGTFYRCSDSGCGKAFRTKYDLRAHVVRRHDGKQQVFCIYDGCSKKFQNDLHLQEHIKFKHSQTTGSSKSYKCTKIGCEKEFKSEQHLNIHHLIHRDEKPVKCQLCDYRCRQQSALVWHVRKHHPEAMPSAGIGRTGSPESAGQEEVFATEHDQEDTQ